MIDETSYASDVAEELELTSSAYASDVAGKVELTSSAYGEDVAEAINEGVVPTPTPTYDLRVLQYNVGHFNMGRDAANIVTIGNSSYSSRPNTNYSTQLQRWENRISGINADIIGMPEWSPNFGYNGSTLVSAADSGIFDGYGLSAGKSVYFDWWINCLAWKESRISMDETDIDDYDLINTISPRAYVRVGETTIKGKTVKVAVTHLNFNRTEIHYNSRKLDIKELIRKFKDDKYVILCGDFNTQGPWESGTVNSQNTWEGSDYSLGLDEFAPFIDGFTEGAVTYEGWSAIANSRANPLLTCEATGSRPDAGHPNYPYMYLDNIIVKGFTMSNIHRVDDGTLTDHCALWCDLTMIEEGGEP